jgi:hypothetical protein
MKEQDKRLDGEGEGWACKGEGKGDSTEKQTDLSILKNRQI